MQVMQEQWVTPGLSRRQPLASYLECLRHHHEWARELATQQRQKAQEKQKYYYDRTAHVRTFQVGDRVLVRSALFPRKVTREWEGPLMVSPRPQQTKVLHVNHLKQWHKDTSCPPHTQWRGPKFNQCHWQLGTSRGSLKNQICVGCIYTRL